MNKRPVVSKAHCHSSSSRHGGNVGSFSRPLRGAAYEPLINPSNDLMSGVRKRRGAAASSGVIGAAGRRQTLLHRQAADTLCTRRLVYGLTAAARETAADTLCTRRLVYGPTAAAGETAADTLYTRRLVYGLTAAARETGNTLSFTAESRCLPLRAYGR